MILTVTAHAAIDRLIFISEFIPEQRLVGEPGGDYVGGGGFDVSVALAGLGAGSLAMGILAGESGRQLEFLLHGYGIPYNLTWVEGETRIVLVIVETDFHRHTHIVTPGCHVSLQDLQVFFSRYRSRTWEADWVIAAGSLANGIPDDFYVQVVEIARQAGVRSLVDCTGEPLRQALSARPDIVQQTLAEFCATFGFELSSLADLSALLNAAQQAVSIYQLESLVIARTPADILALTPAGAYAASCPRQPSLSGAGASHCISAALVWRLSQGDPWPEALRWAAAAGCAGTLTPGTGELRLQDVLKFLPEVQVEGKAIPLA